MTDRPRLTLYRIVRTSPPTLHDFTSKAALGQRNSEADEETRRLESGLSMYRTSAQARKKARAFPFLGGFIAAVSIPFGEDFVAERTTSSTGHHTVWGEPADLLACVVAVEPATR